MYKITILLVSIVSINLFSMSAPYKINVRQLEVWDTLREWNILSNQDINLFERLPAHEQARRFRTYLQEHETIIFNMLGPNKKAYFNRLSSAQKSNYLYNIIKTQSTIFDILKEEEKAYFTTLSYQEKAHYLYNIIKTQKIIFKILPLEEQQYLNSLNPLEKIIHLHSKLIEQRKIFNQLNRSQQEDLNKRSPLAKAQYLDGMARIIAYGRNLSSNTATINRLHPNQ